MNLLLMITGCMLLTFLIAEKSVNADTKKVQQEMQVINGDTYFFNKNGQMHTGWKKYKSQYYFFDRSSGKMKKNCKVDGIKLDQNGRAKKNSNNIKKIKVMIQARKIVNEITNSNDTKKEKLKKCFDWILKFPYRQYRELGPLYKKKGWEVTFANDIFNKGEGCCASQSAALAFLVHECGYKKVYVAHDTSHAWMELNGKVYDPLFAKAKSYKKYFNCTYKVYGLYRAGRRKI